MHTVSLLTVDDEKLFHDIAAAKHEPRRQRLNAAWAAVLVAYQDYEDAAPEVGNLPDVVLTPLQGAALIHAFEVETAPLAKLRGDLLQRVVAARCPFCGLSESSTLDHYLPKELNPQFAVFSKNLVPCCSSCNTRKRDRVLNDETDVRVFLHPYFDKIPVLPFTRVDVTLLPDAMALTYSLIRPVGMTNARFIHLQSHFQLLNLADRYRLMALEHLRGQYRSLVRMYGAAQDAGRVATGFNEKAGDFEEEYGENYWLAVLYRSLAANEEFCDGGFEVLRKKQ